MPTAVRTAAAFSCGVPGCSKLEVVQMVCPDCNMTTCIAHRQPALHSCKAAASAGGAGGASKGNGASASASAQQQPAHTDEPLVGTSGEPLPARAAQMAATVAASKVRSRTAADARVPAANRLHIEVVLETGGTSAASTPAPPPAYICADSAWPCGRLLDVSAAALRIANTNATTTDAGARLHLYPLRQKLATLSATSAGAAAVPASLAGVAAGGPLPADVPLSVLVQAGLLEHGGGLRLRKGLR